MSTRRRLFAASIAGLAVLGVAACEPEAPAATTTTTPPTTTTAPATTVRPMCFPVEGKVTYIDSWNAPRSNGRRHEGQDLMGTKMQRIMSTTNGTVITLKQNHATAGHYLYIKDASGYVHAYMHLNNDTPGTDDGKATFNQTFAPGLAVGTKVKAGEFIGYLGDSGNAEGSGAHLHYELRAPNGTFSGVAINAYPSLQAATKCAVLPAGSGMKG